MDYLRTTYFPAKMNVTNILGGSGINLLLEDIGQRK